MLTVLSALQVLTYLILTTTLGGRYHYYHFCFTDGKPSNWQSWYSKQGGPLPESLL